MIDRERMKRSIEADIHRKIEQIKQTEKVRENQGGICFLRLHVVFIYHPCVFIFVGVS